MSLSAELWLESEGIEASSKLVSGMFSCLRDVNPPSSKYPFSSIRRGDRYGGDPQLLQDWNILEGKLLAMTIAFRVSPVPGPTLFELQYPLPSSFGYTRLHRYRGVADVILERSRNAFYPLMATVDVPRVQLRC